MSSKNWLVRRDLDQVEGQELDWAKFDGEQLILRFGRVELVVEGQDLEVALKGIK